MGAEATNQQSATGGTQASGQQQGEQAGGSNPAPVPYAVFKEANDRAKAAETERDTFKTQLAQYGPAKVQEFESKLNSTREEMGLRVSLARAGVQSDAGLDYLVSRYTGIDASRRPKVDEYIGGLKSAEPAFFGIAPSAAASTTTTTAKTEASATGAQTEGAPAGGGGTSSTSTRTSPDATARAGVVTGQDPPLSDDLIKSMDQETFNRRWPEIDGFMKSKRKGR